MFYCVMCGESFTVEDVKDGAYFPSTGGCLACYQKMAKSSITCFGDAKLYDRKALGCKECPDKRLCVIFVQHPHDAMRER